MTKDGKTRTIVVGNAPSILKTQLGSIIDSYDSVIRINNYDVKNYTDDVGVKTTIWATTLYRNITKKLDPKIDGIFMPLNEIDGWKKSENIMRKWAKDHDITYDQPSNETIENLKRDLKGNKASSGITMLAHIIDTEGCVSAVGFDFFANKQGHHYFNKEEKRPNGCPHKGWIEREWFYQKVLEGKIIKIEPDNLQNELIDKYKELHNNVKSYGSHNGTHNNVIEWIRGRKLKTVLDYGCGKGLLINRYENTSIKVTGYDPAIPKYEIKPTEKFDGVCCTDVLEHIPMGNIPNILQDLNNLAKNTIILNISTRYAAHRFPDGRNCHETVCTSNWWRQIIIKECKDFKIDHDHELKDSYLCILIKNKMAKFPIITIGTSGVDMRQNPLFLQEQKAAFAQNLAFDENTIKTRPDIVYHNLGLKGKFQGAVYFTPRFGLSATTYSTASTAIASVVDGKVYLNTIDEEVNQKPLLIKGTNFKDDTYLMNAESYLVALNKKGATYWWKSGFEMTRSKGLDYSSEENSHDTLDDADIKHWLPWNAGVGHYIHARNHISVDFGTEHTRGQALNSEIFVSDILGKRGCYEANDHLKMEEAMLDSMGGTLVAPSKFGKTVALATLPTEDKNGEGLLVDFRECGVVTHNTDDDPRETLFDPETNTFTQQGWDSKRLTNVRLNSVSAVSRYGVVELPSDIFFRSDYGFHFLKKTFGQGTLKDQTLNHEAHDIQPLFDMDEESDVSGASVGHWIRGNRFMGSVGFNLLPFHSSSSVGRGIAVMNQATTFTEDDTPRPQWEGVWTFDNGFSGIHRFTNGGKRPKDKSYGFIGSDNSTNIYYSEFQKGSTGVDTRDGKLKPVGWRYVSGAFAMNGLHYIDRIHGAVLDFVTGESTGQIKISIKTDETQTWEDWATIDPCTTELSVLSKSIGEPPKKSREGTWFQFKIEGTGYIEIRTFEIDAGKVIKKEDGRNHCVSVCSNEKDYIW